jgi:hypothetical protein
LPWQDTLYIGDGVYIFSYKMETKDSENITPIFLTESLFLVFHIMVSNTTVMEIHKLMELFLGAA